MSRQVSYSVALTSSVAERIKKQKEKILQLWESRIREEIPAASGQPESQLRDSIPKFLDRLAGALSQERLQLVPSEAIQEVSEDHALQRASLKEYSLHEVLRELQILREALFSVLEQDGALSPKERDFILSLIEQGMAESGAHFVEQAQSRTRAIEDRYRLVVEGVKDHAILRISLQGNVLDWNLGAENIFQYKRDEIVGKDARILFVPEDLEKRADEQERKIAAETGKAEDKRWHVKKDGSRFFANGIMNPLRDASGSLIGFVKVLRDETERVQYEERLKLSNNFLEAVISHLPVGVSITDARTGKALYYNSEIEKLTERAVSQRKDIQELKNYGAIHPDGSPYEIEEYPTPRAIKTGEETRNESMLYQRRDGSIATLNINSVPIRDSKGNILASVTTAQDLTPFKKAEEELKKSEANFRLLANALPQIIWTATADFHVDWYNDWWYEYLRLPRGTRWDDPSAQPMHPEDVQRTYPRLKESVDTGKDFVMEQRFRRGSDGQYRWHLVRGVPIRDKSGKITKWIGANTDIHEQKLLLQKLEEEQVLRERFVATLSHDLRTPLTAAKINAQLLMRKADDPEVIYRTAVRISENIERSDRMIRDLLDVNRIRAGERLPIDVSECDITQLVKATVEELSLIHGDRFIVKASENFVGYWSPEALKRVLENLCNNAVKYGARDKAITVTLDRRDANEVLLSVHNWGNPIAREDQDSLFEPYRRTHAAQTGHEKGWGLGLTLVRGLVDAHGGTVKVESSAETGTTFSVFLPIDSRRSNISK